MFGLRRSGRIIPFSLVLVFVRYVGRCQCIIMSSLLLKSFALLSLGDSSVPDEVDELRIVDIMWSPIFSHPFFPLFMARFWYSGASARACSVSFEGRLLFSYFTLVLGWESIGKGTNGCGIHSLDKIQMVPPAPIISIRSR